MIHMVLVHKANKNNTYINKKEDEDEEEAHI